MRSHLLRIPLFTLGTLLTAVVVTRGYGVWRLARSRAGLAEAFDPSTLARVRATVPSICPYARGARLHGPLHDLAALSLAQPYLPTCRPLVDEAASRLARAGGVLPAGDEALIAEAARASHGVASCGRAAIEGGEPRTAIAAAEVLGALSRSLERVPLLLALRVGVAIERQQRELVERFPALPEPPLLVDEDLPARKRDVLAGEALVALGQAGRPDCSPGDLRHSLVLGPLLVATEADGVLRLARGDQTEPSWPDSILMPTGPAQSWRRLLQKVDEAWAMRPATAAAPSTAAARR